jgi:hypothetical protein
MTTFHTQSALFNNSSSGDRYRMKFIRPLTLTMACVALSLGALACGGGGGGNSTATDGSSNTSTALRIEGTLRNASASGRILGPGDGGRAGITVSTLGDSAVTDEFGNFALSVDGASFSGGPAEFTFSADGFSSVVVLNDLIGGPGQTAYANFVVESDGEITGESTDAAGNVLGTTPGARLGCSVTQTFSDGGLGALWKPLSERTGTVVVLMPPEYRNASFDVFNSSGDIVAGALIRDCCDHNGGREHIYLTHSAGALAGSGTPLTVRFEFSDGFVDCRTVDNPTLRYD